MTYDPNQHMMRLKGKDYLPVAPRLCWFRDQFPLGTVTTQITYLDVEKAICVCHARVETGTGGIGEGVGSETARDFNDYIEKASTKAIGRALLSLGFGTANAADELDEGTRIVDTPIERRQPPQQQAKAAPKPTPAPRDQLIIDAYNRGKEKNLWTEIGQMCTLATPVLNVELVTKADLYKLTLEQAQTFLDWVVAAEPVESDAVATL